MASSPTLETSLKWKNPSSLCPQFPVFLHSRSSFHNYKVRTSSQKHGVKCFFTNNSPNNCLSDTHRVTRGIDVVEIKSAKDLVGLVSGSIIKALKALQKPAATAVLVGLLLVHNPNSTLAASGGRIGGSSFSSRSSISSSRSYSIPRTEAGSSFSYSVPYYAPSPFTGVYFGGSSIFLIMVAFAAFFLVSGFLSEGSESSVLTDSERTSVMKLQVGLLGLGRSLQKDLNRIAETANTSTPEGLSYVLTETILNLFRHPDYCISGYSSVEVKKSMDEGEKKFNQLSIEERGKFDEETLVNVNNIKKQSSRILRAGGFSNEYIVITILVAARGVHKLPTVNNSNDLKEALRKLASIPSSKILAVEVLWTPQNEDDTLSERELLEDYPLLRPL